MTMTTSRILQGDALSVLTRKETNKSGIFDRRITEDADAVARVDGGH